MQKYKIRKAIVIQKSIQFGFDIDFMWNEETITVFMIGIGFLCFKAYFCIDKKRKEIDED